ncbi:MAG: chlorite dismutase family protein [Acidobacteria bacterium]|nr:chlorite dismutase family protein [Acidobacteriota bacterium]
MATEAQNERRQYVNFAFYRVDPAWRRLPERERQQGKHDFCRVAEEYAQKMLIFSYSTMGTRSDCDFMLWRISYELEPLQEMTARLLATGLGHYLTTPHSFLAMSKRSLYVKEHVHEGQTDTRARIVPGQHKYLFVYPFVKTREWYRMALPARQEIMNEHIRAGHKYPRVKLNTTYSFGLDDQEFVVAFETDHPADFLDLVMELRETESSRFTLRDTPIFTCVHGSLDDVLNLLGG